MKFDDYIKTSLMNINEGLTKDELEKFKKISEQMESKYRGQVIGGGAVDREVLRVYLLATDVLMSKITPTQYEKLLNLENYYDALDSI